MPDVYGNPTPQDRIKNALDDIQNEIAQGRLNLDRDIYSNIQLPTYQQITYPTYRDVTYPTSVGQNTGYLPQDYAGGYGGMPTFGAFTGAAGLFGRAGTDPRFAQMGYAPGDQTLGGQAQRLADDAQRARERQFAQTFGQTQYDSNQARFNDYTDQANKDRAYALDINADPNSVVAGQILPDWLKPHAEWARQYASQNGGRLPTSQDLRTVLAGSGRTPEDYLPGGRFAGANSNAGVEPLGGQPGQPGMPPAAGPVSGQPQAMAPVSIGGVAKLNADYQALIAQKGVPYLSYNDPDLQRIYQTDLGGDAATNLARADAVAAWSRAHPGQTPDAATQLQVYQGAVAPAAPATPATPAAPAASPDGGTQGWGGEMRQAQQGEVLQAPAYRGGATQQGQSFMRMNPATQPGGVNYRGSGATGQFGVGQAMSQAQRALLEQGRATDVQAQLTQNAQRITEQGQGQDVALRALQQESQLRADPFQLAQYRYGLSQTGIPGVIGAVAGSGVLPGVQGPQGQAPQRPTLGAQIGQATGLPAFGQAPGMAGTNAQLAALPALNQINGRNYLRLGQGGQQYANSAYRAAGLAGSDQDVEEAVKQGLPQFARRGVPTFGRVA